MADTDPPKTSASPPDLPKEEPMDEDDQEIKDSIAPSDTANGSSSTQQQQSLNNSSDTVGDKDNDNTNLDNAGGDHELGEDDALPASLQANGPGATLDGQNDMVDPLAANAEEAAQQVEARIPQKKDATLREFLSKMDDCAPIVCLSLCLLLLKPHPTLRLPSCFNYQFVRLPL